MHSSSPWCKDISRRRFLELAAAAGVASAMPHAQAVTTMQASDPVLDDLAQRCFLFFWEQADPVTGICRDRSHLDASTYGGNQKDMGSTGVTGFALTSMCIGAERGWITRKQAADRVRMTLRSYTNGHVENIHGWFYHFVDVHTGQRHESSEVSVSDAIWLLAGALTCRQYFHEDKEIGDLATLLYSRYDFLWMTNGDGKLLAHGWRPEDGFIKHRYEKYCQLAAMYLLGIGSPTHPLPPDAWYAWERDPNSYQDFHYIGHSVLWTYQYPFAWFDFRGRKESRGTKIDWWQNAITATRAHRAWCLDDLSKQFPGYKGDIWGITSSTSAHGYQAWGGPPGHKDIDGSVVPCASAGALMMTPDISIPAVHAMKSQYGKKIYGRYGFADAFNPNNGWVTEDVLGIDVGITLLSAENYRNQSVWNWFMANTEAQQAFKLAGIDKV